MLAAGVGAMDTEASQVVVALGGGFQSLLNGCLTDDGGRGRAPEPEHSSMPAAEAQNYLVVAAAKAPWAGNGFRHFLEGRLTGDRSLDDLRAAEQPRIPGAKRENYDLAVPVALPVPAVSTALCVPILDLEPGASPAEVTAAAAPEADTARTPDLPCGSGSPPDPSWLPRGAGTAGPLTWDLPPQNDPDAGVEAAEDPRHATPAAAPELAFGVRLLAPAPAAPSSGRAEGLPGPTAGVPGNGPTPPDDTGIPGTSCGALDDGQGASQNPAVPGDARSTFTGTEEGRMPPAAERRDAAPPPWIAPKGAPPSGEHPSGEHPTADHGRTEPGGPVDTESVWNPAPPPPADREAQPAVPAQEASAACPAEVEPPEAPAQPVSRDVSLHMAEGENSVDIRMAERAGEIRVTVHTPDRDLANSLRADLPDLVGKLRQSGFQAEAWRPATQPDAGRRAGSAGFSRQEDSPGARKDGRQQQPQQRQSKDQSRWAGAWQSSLIPTQESPT